MDYITVADGMSNFNHCDIISPKVTEFIELTQKMP